MQCTRRFFAGMIVALSILMTLPASAETLVVATLDWDPYIGRSLPNQGYVAEVVREAFQQEGYELDMKFLPWAKVVALSKKGKFAAYFPEYYARELHENFLVSDPIPGGPLVFFKRKDTTVNFKSLHDLKPYRIGVVRGYVNTAEFDGADFLSKEAAKDDITNMRKLVSGKIDLMVADQFVGRHLLATQMPEKADLVDEVTPVLEDKDLYICFPKSNAQSTKRMQAFNKGIKTLQENGRITEILKAHGF